MGLAVFNFVPLLLVRLMLKHGPPADVEPWAIAATVFWSWTTASGLLFALGIPKYRHNDGYWHIFILFELIWLVGCIVLVGFGTTYLLPRQHPDPTWWKYLLAIVVFVYFRIALWVGAGITLLAVRKQLKISLKHCHKYFCRKPQPDDKLAGMGDA